MELSDGKRMEILTAVRTVLKKSPGIKAKELIRKVHDLTGLGRSTIYEHLFSFVHKGKIYREGSRYWLQKPSERGFNPLKTLADWWERRAERKRIERWNKYRNYVAPALAHFRHRAEFDGVRVFKTLVEEEDRLDKVNRRRIGLKG